jgi:hypothetical protein
LALAATLEGNRSAQPPERLRHFSAAAVALRRFQALARPPLASSEATQAAAKAETEAAEAKTQAATAEAEAWVDLLCGVACNAFSVVDAELRPLPCGAVGIYPQVFLPTL